MKFQVALLAGVLAGVSAHGHLSRPWSRTQVAYENGEDTCPHCVLEDVPDVGEAGRNHPGNRPFAEPGSAHITMGPCGMQNGPEAGQNNYNKPDRSWGAVVETYQAGQTVEFDSCWSQDHHGAYSMRVCQNANLVAPFLDASHNPTQFEMDSLEACFQDGVLPCTDTGSPSCDAVAYGSGCQEGWGCASNTDWFYSAARGFEPSRTRCNRAHGTTSTVKLPAGFTSNHTLLGWRWDALNTAQVYTSCVDVTIV